MEKQIITDVKELLELRNNNQFIGELPTMEKSVIKFHGSNNILVCEKNVKLVNSTIIFNANDSIVYLCQNKNDYKLNIAIYNHSALYIGKDNYINGTLNIVLSERKHVFIGDNGLISFGIWIRTADPHLIYSVDTKKRINPSKSVFIGDHVWLGQGVTILKGAKIHSGSIAGAISVIPGKELQSNCSYVGNPVRKAAEEIFWDGSCVNVWTEEKTKSMETYESDKFIFKFDEDEYVSFDEIDEKLSSSKTSFEMYNYLKQINCNTDKNRFAKKSEKPR